MAYIWQRWLADEYRAAGLTVVEIEGWRNRGRPASVGNFDPDGPSTVHHTGSTSSSSNPRPSLTTLIQGRSDLPGPLCQKATDHNGVVIIIAAGRANHAGEVGKSGVPGMPLGADGNALALGNEVMTDGTQRLTDAQRRSIAIQTAVDVKHFGRGSEYAHRHEDISGTGKWDLGSLTTPQLRADVRAAFTEEDFDMDKDEAKEAFREVLIETLGLEPNGKVDLGDGKARDLGQVLKELWQLRNSPSPAAVAAALAEHERQTGR